MPDALFEHDGQITKREVRAVTLSALAPRRGELLWDIGAGSGSVSIEWMLAHPSLHAIAVEADSERAQRIRRNAAACGVPGLTIVEGIAPQALADLPTPSAVFIGGGGSDSGVLDAAIAAERPQLVERYYGALSAVEPRVVARSVSRMIDGDAVQLEHIITRFVELEFLFVAFEIRAETHDPFLSHAIRARPKLPVPFLVALLLIDGSLATDAEHPRIPRVVFDWGL